MRIRVYPEQLRETAQVLRRAVDLWAEQSAYLGRALNSLNWEVRERARVEGQVAQAIRLAQALAERVGTQAAFLEEAAARFEAADQQGVQGVNAVIETVGKLPDLPSWLSLPRHPALSLGALFGAGSIPMLRLRPGIWETIKFIKDLKEGLKISSALYIISRLRKGKTYPRQVIIRGKSFFKKQVGLSSHLTHISVQNLPKHIRMRALSLSSIAEEIFFESLENWEEYDGDMRRVVVGTLFDTGLGVLLSTGGGVGMAALAGVAVGALPISAPVAAAVVLGGSVLGGEVGSKAAEWIENIKIGGKELDHIFVDFVTDPEERARIMANIVEAGKRSLEKAVDKVASLFRPRR